jgi:hypothetical protein
VPPACLAGPLQPLGRARSGALAAVHAAAAVRHGRRQACSAVPPLCPASWSAANGHLQAFERFFPLGGEYVYEFLRCDTRPGVVLHVQVTKTQGIARASNNLPYVRRGAQNLPVDTPEAMRRLEYAKGIVSFENELANVPPDVISGSEVTRDFIKEVVPSADPETWLNSNFLFGTVGPRSPVSCSLLTSHKLFCRNDAASRSIAIRRLKGRVSGRRWRLILRQSRAPIQPDS